MEEEYYTNSKCPVCGNPIYNPESGIIEINHFTTCSFDWCGNLYSEYSSERIAYCHIGRGFVQFNTDGEYHHITELHISVKQLIEMISNINRSETDIKQFVTNHEFNKMEFSTHDISGQHKLYYRINNQVCQTITTVHKKPFKCKLGLHQYARSEYDILLTCSKCHKAKIDWRKIPIFNKTTGEMTTYD